MSNTTKNCLICSTAVVVNDYHTREFDCIECEKGPFCEDCCPGVDKYYQCLYCHVEDLEKQMATYRRKKLILQEFKDKLKNLKSKKQKT